MVLANNDVLFDKLIEGGDKARSWQTVKVDLSAFKGDTVTLRLYQRVLITGRAAGNAYWKNLRIE